MCKKIIFILVFISVQVFALNVGDTLNQKSIKQLKLQKDKIYVLDFFASWCASCKIELPLIEKLNNTIDKNKYQIIGINSDKDINIGKKFVAELNLNFDIIYDNENKLISYFEPIGVPAIYYIKNNKIKKVIYGAVHNIDKQILNDLKAMEE